jgi:hypothetical protein
VLAMALVILSSWFGGGMRSGIQQWLLGFSFVGLLLVPIQMRERPGTRLHPLVPALLWVGFTLVALLNPSHVQSEDRGWLPRVEWIRWLPTTADVAHTLAAARVWLAALLVGGLVWMLLRNSRVVRAVWAIVALNGFALAAVGAFFHFSGANQMLGMIEPPEPTYFFATFFYKNHWAAYGALTTVASFTLALRAVRPALGGDPKARGRLLLFSATGLLTAVTLPLPGSRSGVLLATIVVGTFLVGLLVLAIRGRSRGTSHRWMLAGGVLLVAGILAFGANAYAPKAAEDLARTRRQLARGLDGEALELRMLVSRDTWRMAQTRPLFGWGAGCFEIVFPIFQGDYLRDAARRPAARLEFAHNDWLQILAENGFVGGALLVFPAIACGWIAWRRAEFAGRVALGGCLLIAAYAWFDFPFHNPAVLMLWVILVASAHRLRTSTVTPP